MPPSRLALALVMTLIAAPLLPGCDNTSRLTVQEHIQRAKDFEDQGKLKGSVVELKNALQKSPDNAQARLLLGQIYLKLGQGAEAEKELNQAEKYGVGSETVKPLLGEALLLMGEYKRVLNEIQPSEKTSKQNVARIYQIRAEAMFNQQNVKDACALFQKSLEVDAGNPPTYWGLAQCALVDHDPVKARALLDSALKINSRQAQTWVFIGNLESLNKNQQSAIAAYTNALKIDPNHLEALQNRAALYLADKQLDAAQKDVEHVNTVARKSITAYYLQALLNFEQKNFAAAQDGVQEVLKNSPDYLPAILLAGSTAYELGSYQQAETYLNRYLSRFPHNAYAIRVLAATQIKQNQPDNSLGTLAPLLAADAKDASTLVLAAEALRMKGESEKAAEYLQRAAALDPKNPDIQTQLGLSHLSAGNNQAAIAELSRAAAMESGQPRADVLLIMTLLDLREFDKALAAIDSTRKKLPRSALLLTMQGSALLGKRDLANARKGFEDALSIEPAFFPAAASLAQLDLADNKPAQARQRFERLLDKDKNNLQAMLALAELAAADKQEATYVDWLEKAAKAHPKAIQPRAILVRYHLARNEPQRALAIANEAVAANPDNPAALDLLGSAQLGAKDKLGAASTFTKLAQEADQSPDALQRLAYAQLTAGKQAEAQSALDKALKLDPGHLASLDTLMRIEMRDGQTDKAMQLARQMQTRHPESALGFEREGDILLFLKRPDQAAQAFEKAQNISPGAVYVIKLHRALTLAGNAQAADQGLNNWIKLNPNDLQARGYLAENLMAHGRSQEAIAAYEAILQQTPDNAIVLNNLAGLYLGQGDARARATAERALKLVPDSPAIQDTLGWLLIEQGKPAEGLELLRKALGKLPKNDGVRYHYAIALIRTGNKAGGQRELEALLRDAPRSPLAEAARNQLQKP